MKFKTLIWKGYVMFIKREHLRITTMVLGSAIPQCGMTELGEIHLCYWVKLTIGLTGHKYDRI